MKRVVVTGAKGGTGRSIVRVLFRRLAPLSPLVPLHPVQVETVLRRVLGLLVAIDGQHRISPPRRLDPLLHYRV